MSEQSLAVMPPTRLAPIQPHSFEEIEKFAVVMADSDLVPKDYKGKPANVCVAIIMGRELGVPPMQALQGIAVINGRPSVWGDLMWALVTGHPDFEDAVESVTDTEATCKLVRRGRSPVTEVFSKDDAVKASLWGKAGPWTQYPKRMMMWRARTFAARNLFADALKGIQIREEVQDYIDGETVQPEKQTVAFAHPDAGTRQEKRPETIKGESKPDPVKAEPAKEEPVKADEKPVDDRITKDQSKEFNDARKKSGYNAAETTLYLERVWGGNTTGALKASRFAEAMLWANTPKEAPKPEAQAMSGDEAFCHKTWAKLNTSTDDRAEDLAKFTTADGTDWETLGLELHSRMEGGE